MDSNFEQLLFGWPLCVLRDVDIATVISDSPRRYAAVNRALKNGTLTAVEAWDLFNW